MWIRGSATTDRRARPAPDPVELVTRVLLLERQRGYTNQAVIGGLEKFIGQWLPDTPAGRALDGYDTLQPTERARRLDQALSALTGGSDDGAGDRRFAPTQARQNSVTTHRPESPAARASSHLDQRSAPNGSKVADSARPIESASARSRIEAAPAEPARTTPPRARARRARPSPAPVAPADRSQVGSGLETPVRRLTGVGPTNARRLERLGIVTVRDLLYHFPSRHVDYSQLKKVAELTPGELATVVVSVWDVGSSSTRRGFERIESTVGDETGNMLAVWFRRRDYFGSKLRGRQVVLSGKVESRNGRLYLNDPEIEFLEQADLVSTARHVPMYRLTEGLNQRWIRNLAKGVVDRYAPMVVDHVPAVVRRSRDLLDLPAALRQIHFPDDENNLNRARRRLAFDELLMIQLTVARRRQQWESIQSAPRLTPHHQVETAFRSSLPFSLTRAQERVLGQILADIARGQPMGRLLQGDVGAGKTVVAALAMLGAATSGYQSTLMAPTEILAEQHFRTIERVFSAPELRRVFEEVVGREGPEVALLVGSTPRAKRRAISEAAIAGTVDVLVGTHALIQQGVVVRSLGLAIVDEQHRFGVEQRAALRQKGSNAHLLVMTATPIPRTLALTLYGELDLSIIDELPPGRQRIKTRWVTPDKRRGAYEFVRREVQSGRQAFVVCPLIEESENVVARAAVAEYERLQTEEFPELRLGLLHGRMTAAEKEAAMSAFRDRVTDILVATAVIEVGIDIPNATVMVIEGADRFGLAQLHQLRGRVGRGAEQSYCILLSEAPSLDGQERLRVIEETNDGFALAEEDLRLRGPGEFLGTRQSGLPELRIASIGDIDLVEETREAAFGIIGLDPELELAEHHALRDRLALFSAAAADFA